MNKEQIFNLEENVRGKWKPLLNKNDKQKIALITEEQADVMNKQSRYHKIRYVKAISEELENKELDIEELKKEYKEVVGKEPHHKAKSESLIKAIEEAKK